MRVKIYEAIRRIRTALFGCHKEQLGYRCRHRVYDNGFRECGK